MSRRFDCIDAEQRAAGLVEAASAVRRGELVVLPTDTVYGIGADAFTPAAVSALLEAKGRGRDMPVPVLVGTVRAANALVENLGPYGQDLVDAFWPGPLTLICRANRSLSWDLGDAKGTVAIRMPLHAVALDLLKETGPMAVSSANRSGAPAATGAADAEKQLGDSVSVYLDAGPCESGTPSTILDLTTAVPRLLRRGAITVEKLRGVIGYVATDEGPEPDGGTESGE
ncbi:L-threonylcarbamoyladenylate synthase [Streptosporangium sp. NBC_01755]|uniref:L-threonylcarbamoyladenylate synthase n=1 Tax=unclassified Streptosporangium TaxID=2632669 RepID=UPI002DDBA406|nr:MULTISPECIES: L-threonylcarbamoyladenylate synthase [unclassified Streptosporangium]WSA23922.1 L-threonylcarbamoyladenylate synthase [Streptosporangium sp. NBC_01810]WSC98003.1 L-threonylcarbamoyladenylate synthase [Streptosporangium sp. NBC_01755]